MVTSTNSFLSFLLRGSLLASLVAILSLRCDALFDTESPTIEIIKPAEGVSYFGTLPIELEVTDNRRVDHVEISLGEDLVKNFEKEPYAIEYDIAEFDSIPKTLHVIAHDRAGNWSEAERQIHLAFGLKITSPNGGESWLESSTQNIRWENSGNVGNSVSISYSIDGGLNWTSIANSIENTGSCFWTLPSLINTEANCRVKVASTSTSYTDISDGNFSISAEPNFITVISPNGGEEWSELSNQSISWVSSGDVGSQVIIQYTYNGSDWLDIAESTSEVGSILWNLPHVTSTQTLCRVIVASTTTSHSDVSDAVFSIIDEDHITMSSPVGGESWPELSDQIITWNKSDSTGESVSIYYSLNEGISWTTITTLTPNDGEFPWIPPDYRETQTACRIKVASTTTNYADSSEANFTITDVGNIVITSPNNGEEWPELSTQTITWDKNGSVGDSAGLYYTLIPDMGWSEIIASIPNNGSYSWILPDVAETQTECQVKVVSNTGHFDISNANFTITDIGNIFVTFPNGGEEIVGESSHTITWDKSGATGGSVSLSYSTDGGGNWIVITSSALNDGSHEWPISYQTQTQTACRVMVASTTTNHYDISDSNFTLLGETISTPSSPGGPFSLHTGNSYSYSTGGSTSNYGHDIEYRFDWGDGVVWDDGTIFHVGTSAWSTSTTASHTWDWFMAGRGSAIKAQARCATHTSVVSGWSSELIVVLWD